MGIGRGTKEAGTDVVHESQTVEAKVVCDPRGTRLKTGCENGEGRRDCDPTHRVSLTELKAVVGLKAEPQPLSIKEPDM